MDIDNTENHNSNQKMLSNNNNVTNKLPLQETSPNLMPPSSSHLRESPIKLVNNRKRAPTTPIKQALVVNTRRKLQEVPPTPSRVNVLSELQQTTTTTTTTTTASSTVDKSSSTYTKLHPVELGDYTMYGNTVQEIETNYNNYLMQYKMKYLEDVNEFLRMEREFRLGNSQT